MKKDEYYDDDLDLEVPFYVSDEEEETPKKKNDGPIMAVLVVIGIGLILFCGYKIASTLYGYNQAVTEYETVAKDFTDYIGGARVKPEEEQTGEEIAQIVEEAEEESDVESLFPLVIDHEALLAQNPDYVGWLYFQNGNISYPIVQDNEGESKYLTTTFEGKHNASGAIFIDKGVASDFSDLNTIIYGHNMKNGAMFGSLKNLYNQPTSLTNPYFFISTKDELKTYKVFGIVKTTNKSGLYQVPKNEAAYQIFVNEIGATASYFDASATGLSTYSPIVMFSTCYGAQGTSDRLLVFGVLQ